MKTTNGNFIKYRLSIVRMFQQQHHLNSCVRRKTRIIKCADFDVFIS